MPTHWPDAPLAAFDLETTGVDPATARIVEVALHLDVPGEPVSRLVDTLVDPGAEVEIPPGAAAVHGITRERLDAEGAPPAPEVLRQVHRALTDLADRGVAVVIFNASYDWPLLAAELARLDPPLALPGCALIDPLVLDRHVDRYRKGKRTLEAACQVYDIVLDGAHQAGADAVASVAVARAIGHRYPAIAACTPAELQPLQTEAFRVWRDSFNDYLRRQGADRPPVTGEWPGTELLSG